MRDFSWQMNEWVRNTITAIESEAQDMAEYAIKSVIEKSPHPSGANGRPSPYSTGEFVNNWKIGSSTTSDYTTAPATSKEAKITELLGEVNGWFKNNKTLFIYNSGPYVAQVEYLGWKYSDEYAPIRRTTDEIKTKWSKR